MCSKNLKLLYLILYQTLSKLNGHLCHLWLIKWQVLCLSIVNNTLKTFPPYVLLHQTCVLMMHFELWKAFQTISRQYVVGYKYLWSFYKRYVQKIMKIIAKVFTSVQPQRYSQFSLWTIDIHTHVDEVLFIMYARTRCNCASQLRSHSHQFCVLPGTVSVSYELFIFMFLIIQHQLACWNKNKIT